MSADPREQVLALLAACRTASLATVDAGRPHAANVQYVSDGELRLYWVSSPDAAHSRHLERDPHAAITIYTGDERPEQIRGVQMHGLGELIAQRGDVWQLYAAKFPFVEQQPYQAAVEAQQFYCFTPTWVRWIDNRRGFGFRVEMGE